MLKNSLKNINHIEEKIEEDEQEEEIDTNLSKKLNISLLKQNQKTTNKNKKTFKNFNDSLYKNPPNSEKTNNPINENKSFNKSENFNLKHNSFSSSSESDSFKTSNANDQSSFRKNYITKKFEIDKEEMYEQFFEFYFTNVFNFNNFAESEENSNLLDENHKQIKNSSSSSDDSNTFSQFNNDNKNSNNNENNLCLNKNENFEIKNLLILNNSELLKELSFKSEAEKNLFEQQYQDLIFKLRCVFKFISEENTIELLNLMIKKQKEIHVFQFLNAFYLFNTVSRYMNYYSNLIASQQYKSRAYSSERINEFYAIDTNRDFTSAFKNFKTIYLDEELDEFTNLSEFSKNKREFKLDEICKEFYY